MSVSDILPAVAPEKALYFVQVGVEMEPFLAQPPPRSHASANSNAILYPGDAGAAGLIAGIIAHAAIQSSVTSAREREFKAMSQARLAPYADLLQATDVGVLKQQALEELSLSRSDITPDYFEGAYVIAMDPQFVLTFQEKSWGLAAKLRIFTSLENMLEEADSQYERDIYIESVPSALVDWHADGGRSLHHVIQALLSDAIVLGLDDYLDRLPSVSAQEQTIRYLANGKKQVERGFLIDDTEHRVVFQSLNGELKALPIMPQKPPRNTSIQK